jgi:hypothetical protein
MALKKYCFYKIKSTTTQFALLRSAKNDESAKKFVEKKSSCAMTLNIHKKEKILVSL